MALSALSIDPLVCIWYFGDYYKYPNPHFSADAHDMSKIKIRTIKNQKFILKDDDQKSK